MFNLTVRFVANLFFIDSLNGFFYIFYRIVDDNFVFDMYINF